MSTLFDELTRQIGSGMSRRHALRQIGGTFIALALSSIGIKTARAAALSPTCGTCQACDLDTNTCGLPCDPASAGTALCTQAGSDGSYLRLANHLTNNNFVVSGASNVLELLQNGQLLGTALATDFTNANVTGETATIQYVVSATGAIAPLALVSQGGVTTYVLSVDPSGRVVQTIVTQNTTAAAAPLSPSAKILPLTTSNPGLCNNLVEALCSTGGGLACYGAGLLICPETGPGVIPCGILVTVICGGIALYGCDATQKKICGSCPINQQICGEVCCDPCMDCVNGTCKPNVTCPDVCCNNVCCAPGMICSNNTCTSPNSGCVGATCSTFVPCSTNTDCVCVTIAEGGGLCVPGSTACAGLALCSSTADCPAGSLCAIGTCCGDAVCVPTSLTCPPSTADFAKLHAQKTAQGSGPTIGHH